VNERLRGEFFERKPKRLLPFSNVKALENGED
jgi:hypothetical protein